MRRCGRSRTNPVRHCTNVWVNAIWSGCRNRGSAHSVVQVNEALEGSLVHVEELRQDGPQGTPLKVTTIVQVEPEGQAVEDVPVVRV